MNASVHMCRVCGRPWCPHNLARLAWSFRAKPWNRFIGGGPDWLGASWFSDICGSCAGRFVTWATLPSQDIDSINEGEFHFLRWLVREFKIELKHFIKTQEPRYFCNGFVSDGFIYCSNIAWRDGFCRQHHSSYPEQRSKSLKERKVWLEQFEAEMALSEEEEYWSG